jgi:hypothetical protein
MGGGHIETAWQERGDKNAGSGRFFSKIKEYFCTPLKGKFHTDKKDVPVPWIWLVYI